MKNKITILGLSVLLGAGIVLANKFSSNTSNLTYTPRNTNDNTTSASGMLEYYKLLRKNVVTGKIEASDYTKALQELAIFEANSATRAVSLGFQLEGPDNYGGRTRAILVDKNNNNVLYAGSVSGGLYKSTNRGNSWEVLTSFNSVLSVSTIAQTNNGTIYVGTGSSFENTISDNSNTGGHGADGVWYTTDGGATFQKLSTTPNFGSASINEIVAAPNANDKIWIAGSIPVRLTSCENKTTFLTHPDITGGIQDLQISKDGNVLIVNQNNRTYVSTNAGGNFTRVSGFSAGQLKELASTPIVRMEFAISHEKNASGKYNIFASQIRSGSLGILGGVSVSQDNGLTWTEIIPETPNSVDAQTAFNFDPFSGGTQWQGEYDNIISCIPGSPNSFIIGGVRLFRFDMSTSQPPFGNFYPIASNQADETSTTYVHSDIHWFTWDNTGRLYIGSDGGVAYSDNLTQFYTANRGYNTLQYYEIGYSKNGDVIGGSQDNGTTYKNVNYAGATGKEFRDVFGGDGFSTDISYLDPTVMFASSQNTNFARIKPDLQNGGLSSFTDLVTSDLIGLPAPFHTTFRHYENENDLNSTDSVLYIADTVKNIGDVVTVTSKNLSIKYNYTLTQPLGIHFDTTIYYDSNLNPIDTLIVKNGDTLKVQDTKQSLTALGLSGNGGVWVSRNTLRFGPVWWKVIDNVAGNNIVGVTDLEFSKDGNILYVAEVNGKVTRVKGFNNVYYNDQAKDTINGNPNADSVAYKYADVRSGTQQLEVTVIRNPGSQVVTGIAVDPNDPENVVLTLGGYGAGTNIIQSSTAASTMSTSSFVSIKGNLPTFPVYEAIIDYVNPNYIVIGTEMGVYATDNGGSTWTSQNNEMGVVPVYDLHQQWRPWNKAANHGVIYAGTHGRGIWSSGGLTNIKEITKEQENKPQTIAVYPNPSATYTNLAFDLKQNTDLTFQVYNIQGKLVETKVVKNATAGNYVKTLDISSYNKGTYFVNVKANGTNFKVAKFIKN